VRRFVLQQRLLTESPDARAIIQTYHYSASEEPFPCLPLLACRMFGGSDERALPLTGAYYLTNLASEVLDDHMDGEPNKLWSQWGGSRTTLAAVDLLMLSQACLAQTPVNADVLREVTERFSEAVLITSSGQRKSVQRVDSIDAYWRQAIEKSGAAFAFGMWSGARIADASPQELDAASRFGAKLGVLSQVMDDVIDFMSSETNIRGASFEFENALPVVLALASTHEHNAVLREKLGTPTQERTNEWYQGVRRLVLELQGLSLALTLGRQYRDELLDGLNQMGPGQGIELREHIDVLTAIIRRIDAVDVDRNLST